MSKESPLSAYEHNEGEDYGQMMLQPVRRNVPAGAAEELLDRPNRTLDGPGGVGAAFRQPELAADRIQPRHERRDDVGLTLEGCPRARRQRRQETIHRSAQSGRLVRSGSARLRPRQPELDEIPHRSNWIRSASIEVTLATAVSGRSRLGHQVMVPRHSAIGTRHSS